MTGALILVASLALAQNPEYIPSTAEHLAEHAFLVGQWQGEVKIEQSPDDVIPEEFKVLNGKPLVIRTSIRWGLKKCVQVIQVEFEVPGFAVGKGMAVKGWDPKEKKVVQVGVSDVGGWDKVYFTRIDDKSWTESREGIDLLGRTVVEEIHNKLIDADTIEGTMVRRAVDGKEVTSPKTPLIMKRVAKPESGEN